MTSRREVLEAEGLILDETITFTLRQVCESSGVFAERVIEMVEYGIVDPDGGEPGQWRFRADAVFRIRRTLNLCQDLGLNLAGASLALDLLDELAGLRLQVERLSRLRHGDGP